MSSVYQPKLADLGIALVPWFIIMFSTSVIRLETNYWVNMTMLSVVYPALVHYLGQSNLLLGMTRGSLLVTLTVSILSLITVTEGIKWQKLKQSFKQYGKDPKLTAMATGAIMISTMFGLFVASYTNRAGMLQM
ncbi:MAG: hypothetical protein HOI07_03655 [Betaproteobacteria bacterium]|nr:hypothetical protein [Betaproteobacteria bacterium]